MKNIENIEYIEEYIDKADAGLIGLLMARCGDDDFYRRIYRIYL